MSRRSGIGCVQAGSIARFHALFMPYPRPLQHGAHPRIGAGKRNLQHTAYGKRLDGNARK
jgi:hypothetical protein